MKRLRTVLIAAAIIGSLVVPASADNISQIIGDNNTVIFIDVPETHWAANEIRYFSSQGIVNGMPDGSFQPDSGVTREAFAKMMVLTFHATPSTPEEPTFLDVDSTRWSYSYVEASKDFLTGYVSPFDGSKTFHPEEYATREDIAVALVRMMGLTAKDASNSSYASWMFSDAASISPNLLPYVSLAAERGLINGFPDGTFGPQKPISRAETVVLLNRASKQAVTDTSAEIPLSVSVSYDRDDPKIAYLTIASTEGVSVTVDGQSVEMSSDYYDSSYSGLYTYAFQEEGSKEFTVTATKLGQTRTVQATAKYEIGAPTLTITDCPTNVTKKEVTIKGKLTDSNYDVSLTINGESVNVDYWTHSWEKSFTLTEGENTFTIVASNSVGKQVTETRTINFSVGGPNLTISSCPTNVTKKEVTIKGKLTDSNYDVSLTINGEPVNVDYWTHSWEKSFTLTEGENTFTIVASNSVGKQVTETRTINFSVGGPNLTISSCPTNVTKKEVTIKGKLTDPNYDVSLTINGEPVNVDYWTHNWEKSFTLTEGENTFTIVASNSVGKQVTETRTISFSIGGPQLTITECPTSVTKKEVTIKGKLTDSNYSVSLTINGEPVNVDSWNGSWQKSYTLSEGENTFTFVASNEAGKTATETRTVVFNITPPTIRFYNCPPTVTRDSVTITGNVESGYGTVRLFLDGAGEAVSLDYDGDFSIDIVLSAGENTFEFRAVNEMGKETTETKTISYEVETSEETAPEE